MCAALVVGNPASVAPPTTTPHMFDEYIESNNKSMCAALVVGVTASVAPPTIMPHKYVE